MPRENAANLMGAIGPSAPPNLLPFGGEAHLFRPYYSALVADRLFESLKSLSQWKQIPIRIFGKEILQPRLTAWFSDPRVEYSYSGLIFRGAEPWPIFLEEIRKEMAQICGAPFNSVLLNFYRDGQDSMGWHQDDEKELGQNPVIASLSFGAERALLFRHKLQREKILSVPLPHGSLLVMKGETQHCWQHAIAKSKKISQPRINLTFRQILTPKANGLNHHS